MRWYLLRDRRHEGPYSKEQVIEGLKAGTIHARDYLLPEAAIEDQNSFVYLTISEIVEPEVLFDLKKNEVNPPKTVNLVLPDAAPKKDFREEFEKGLESELFQQVSSTNSSMPAYDPNAAQAVDSAGAFRFPWKLAAGIGVVVLFAGFLLQPTLNLLDSGSDLGRSPSTSTGLSSGPKGNSRSPNTQNRVPSETIELPSTVRSQEPESDPASSAVIRDNDATERVVSPKKARKRGRNEEMTEESEAASDEEGFDQEEEVEDDTAEEEVVDESDI